MNALERFDTYNTTKQDIRMNEIYADKCKSHFLHPKSYR